MGEKFSICIIIVTIFLFTPLVKAENLSCQYITNITLYKEELKLVDTKSNTILGDPLLIENYGKSKEYKDQIKIINTLNDSIIINVSFYQEITYINITNSSATYELNSRDNIKIPVKSFEILSSDKGFFAVYITRIPSDTLKYMIISPSGIELRKMDISYIEPACKLCNGVICKGIGDKCTSNGQCGSGICNIASICGEEKIVNCEKYIANSLNCNNVTCAIPSNKKVGQAYSCAWECESGRGMNGVCRETIVEQFVTYIILLLVVIIIFFTAYYLIKRDAIIRVINYEAKKKKEEQAEELETAKEELAARIANLRNKHSEIKKKIDELKHIQGQNKAIEDLQKDLENNEKKLKEKIESKKQTQLEHDQLLRDMQEKEKQELEDWKKFYKDKWKHDFELDENGYFRFKEPPKGLLHRHVYRILKNDGKDIPKGYDVDHINGNKRDNRPENLQLLTKEEHNRKHKLLYNSEFDKY